MKLRKKRNVSGIPVAAMGDIAFLLLIFYISTTMLTDQKPREVELPRLNSEIQSSPYPLIIYLDSFLAKNNMVYFFNEEIPISLLDQKIYEKASNAPTSFRVYLNIEKDLPFRYMYEVIQKLKSAGIKHLIITTKETESL
ncbi:MAG: ExbD/TolR family protein [Leptonema sp. (in: bacteria)]